MGIALQQQIQQQMQQQFQMAMNGGNGREQEQVAHNNEDGEPESKIDAIQKQIDALRSVLMKEKEKLKKRNGVTSQSVEKEKEKEKEKKKEDTSYSSENAVDGASVDTGLETKTDATNTDLLQKTPGKETTKRLSSSARLDSPRDLARQRMAEAALRRSNSVDSEQAD